MKNPINDYNNYLRNRYGERVQKITVLGGFTCPNRDGSKGIGGCTYCNNASFAAPERLLKLSLTDQINHGIQKSRHRYKKVNKYIIYFQSYSNTYAPLARLKELYQEALAHPQVIGLSIGTRPDCVDEEKLDYLAELNKSYDITIEYGIESVFDESLKKLNRCVDHATARWAITETAKRGIPVCAHIILGLPGETKEMMAKMAQEISSLPIHSLKIHQLHIVRNTALGSEYLKNPFHTLSLDEYREWLIIFIENLRSDIYIQRLMGEAPDSLLLSPPWPKKLAEFGQDFIRYLNEHSSFQGIRAKSQN